MDSMNNTINTMTTLPAPMPSDAEVEAVEVAIAQTRTTASGWSNYIPHLDAFLTWHGIGESE